MSLFVLIAMDRPGGLALRIATREAHLAYVQANAPAVRLAGPFLDEAGAMVGSMLLIEAETLQAAETFRVNDPYALAGLFQSAELRPWRVTIGALA